MVNRRSFSLILWQIPFKYRFCLLTCPFHSISLRIDEERTLKNLLRFQTKRSYIMKQRLTHSCMNHRWTAANLSVETNMPHSFWPLLFSLLPRSFFFQVQLPHRGITEDSRHSGGIGSALWWDPMAPFPLVSGSFIHWSIWSSKSIQMLNQFESSPYI